MLFLARGDSNSGVPTDEGWLKKTGGMGSAWGNTKVKREASGTDNRALDGLDGQVLKE